MGIDFLKIAQIGTVTTAAVTALTALLTKVVPWLKLKIDARSITKNLGHEIRPQASLRYYIPPDCQDIDPAGADEPRLVVTVKEKLFSKLDELLSSESEFRYIIILADSGMGKSSALINYAARHLRRFSKPFRIAFIPLGQPDADKRMLDVIDKGNTVLFLDAFDEDVHAISDHSQRLIAIIEKTRNFRKVIVTCRTQFFKRDEEIPTRTGVLKVGSRSAGEPAEHYFHKLYLSPFSNLQVEKFIRKRFPVWKFQARKRAYDIVETIPNLVVRPMLLTHIEVFLGSVSPIQNSWQLYDYLVKEWIKRERGLVADPDSLIYFSEKLAVDLYINRLLRGGEFASSETVSKLAHEWGVKLEPWQLTGRSLLNRDGEGNYKFAHRSILEFLYVRACAEDQITSSSIETPWTDQMKTFLFELAEIAIDLRRPVRFSPVLGEKLHDAQHLAHRFTRETVSLVIYSILTERHETGQVKTVANLAALKATLEGTKFESVVQDAITDLSLATWNERHGFTAPPEFP